MDRPTPTPVELAPWRDADARRRAAPFAPSSARRRALRAAVLALAAGTAARHAGAQAPGAGVPPEPLDETWTDERRQRALPMRVRFPAGDGPAPVVIFSHGLGGNRAGGERWSSAWAQAGFVVVHPQHVGSDTAIFLGGREGVLAGASVEQFLARVRDVGFVLDEIERRRADTAGPWRRTAGQRIAMTGHSFGAHITLALAGERYPAAAPVGEPRFAAFVAFSPTAVGEPAQLRERYAGLRRPFLAVTGTLDGDVIGNGATPENRQRVYPNLPEGAAFSVVLDGADHMTFAGNAGLRARAGMLRREALAIEREEAHAGVLARVTTDFLAWALRDDAAAHRRLLDGAGVQPPDRWFAK